MDRVELIRNRNVASAVERHPELSGDEVKLLDELSRRIVKGLLEAPIAELSGELANEGHRQMVAMLFHLDDADNDEHLE